uniref:Uncharacterized protein n=1 Tax=Leersia perrieri TaxID=77586 RepID=A0A0D9WVF1_9ORYZ
MALQTTANPLDRAEVASFGFSYRQLPFPPPFSPVAPPPRPPSPLSLTLPSSVSVVAGLGTSGSTAAGVGKGAPPVADPPLPTTTAINRTACNGDGGLRHRPPPSSASLLHRCSLSPVAALAFSVLAAIPEIPSSPSPTDDQENELDDRPIGKSCTRRDAAHVLLVLFIGVLYFGMHIDHYFFLSTHTVDAKR